MSTNLGTAALIDSMGRFVANVGVPAAIALILLWQITPRLDRIGDLQAQQNTNLAILQATCGQRPFPTP
jgi:hypothetical protein